MWPPPDAPERSAADVSGPAGMPADTFSYHPPLCRRHPRLHDSGIVLRDSALPFPPGARHPPNPAHGIPG